MNTKVQYAGIGSIAGAAIAFVWFAVQGVPTAAVQFFQKEDVMNTSSTIYMEPGGLSSLSFLEKPGRAGGGMGGGRPMFECEHGTMPTEELMEYDYYETKYVYDGNIDLPEEDVQVYVRNKPTAKPSINNIDYGFAENMVNWSAFRAPYVNNISFEESATSPFTISVDYNEGTISMYRMMDPSLRPDATCIDQACYDRNRLRESDMLSDAEVIHIANTFVEQFALNMTQYGEPQIAYDWRSWYEKAENKSEFYFPDQITVVYPLLINNKVVYEEHGEPVGVQINVDVRNKAITNMFNYSLQEYEVSTYAPMQDAALVKKVLEHGTMYFWDDPNAKTAEATLGEPIEGYMNHYEWDDSGQRNTHLFVPALIFPVIQQADTVSDVRKNVVIPLASEVYEASDSEFPMPMPMPMPIEPNGAPAIEPAGE